ncbi:MAG: hypothetical protein AAFW46_09860 [Pseudomonadota bacterium]
MTTPPPPKRRPGAGPRRRASIAALMAATALSSTVPAAIAQERAQERARVSAGEHGAFSRVVLQSRPADGWRATPTPNGIEIRLPDGPGAIDARDVTERRKAHRVETLSSRREGSETILRLGFNCDCVGRAYTLRGAMLVVDVRDRDGSDPAPAEQAASVQEAAGRPAAPAPDQSPASDQASDAAAPAETKAEQVAAAREILLRQLKAAANQGLIAFREPDPQRAEANEADGPDAAPTPQDADAPPETLDAEKADAAAGDASKQADDRAQDAGADGPAAEASSDDAHEGGSDRPPLANLNAHRYQAPTWTRPTWTPPAWPEPSSRPRRARSAAEEPRCLASSSLDAFSWVEDRPFFDGLAARRRGLYDDLNKVDPFAVEGLMRFYLGHGLGLEAAHVARAFEVETESAQLLADLGDVVAGKPPRAGGPFDRATPCDGRHGLWQAAAVAEHDLELALAAFARSTDALSLTPDPLRRILGGRIGAAAARAGRYEIARDILALLARSGGEPTEDMLWIEAALAFHDGRTLAGRRALRDIVALRGPGSPEALTRLGDTLEAPLESALAERTADALADFALQYRGSAIGLASSIAEARLRARFRDLSGAVEALDLARGRATPQQSESLAAAQRAMIADEIAKLEQEPTSQGAVHTVQAIEHLRDDAQGDDLKVRLARILIRMNAPKLVELAIDEAAAARSPEAAAALAEAQRRVAMLVSPVDVVGRIEPIGGSEDATPADPAAAGAIEIGRGPAAASEAEARAAENPEVDGAEAPSSVAAEAGDAPETRDAGNGAAGNGASEAVAQAESLAEPTAPAPPEDETAPDPRPTPIGPPPPSRSDAKKLIEAVDDDLKRLKKVLKDG